MVLVFLVIAHLQPFHFQAVFFVVPSQKLQELVFLVIHAKQATRVEEEHPAGATQILLSQADWLQEGILTWRMAMIWTARSYRYLLKAIVGYACALWPIEAKLGKSAQAKAGTLRHGAAIERLLSWCRPCRCAN